MQDRKLNIELLKFYAAARLRAEVKQTYLSYLWWVLEPLFLILAFYFVFGVLLERGGPGFIYILLVGVVFWTWFANSVTQASSSIFRANFLINQVNVDKRLFPLATLVVQAFKQSINIVLLLVFLVFLTGIQISWLYLPLLVLTQFFLITSLGLLTAAALPFVPDLQYVITLAMRFLMFCSGVFFTVDNISEQYRDYYLMNPMANLLEQYRDILLRGDSVDWHSIAWITTVSVIIGAVSNAIILKNHALYPRLAAQ